MTSNPTTARPESSAAPEESMAPVAPCDVTARTRRLWRGLVRRLAGDRGAATAEYAVATMAAVGFAGLLVVILRGDEVRGILTDLVRNALTVG